MEFNDIDPESGKGSGSPVPSLMRSVGGKWSGGAEEDAVEWPGGSSGR